MKLVKWMMALMPVFCFASDLVSETKKNPWEVYDKFYEDLPENPTNDEIIEALKQKIDFEIKYTNYCLNQLRIHDPESEFFLYLCGKLHSTYDTKKYLDKTEK
jgi:hypothetical protein